MAFEWTWLNGQKQTALFPTSTPITKGAPCYLSSNLLVVCADGGSVDVVCDKDATAGDSAVLCIIPNADIFLAKITGAVDLSPGARVYLGSNYAVDAGSAEQTSQAFLVNFNPASGGCADICVTSALHHPLVYGQV